MEPFRYLGCHLFKISSSTALGIWRGFEIMASTAKNGRLTKKIGTHSGTFHCDEALACFMLKLLPEYAEAEIIRTRDLKELDKCDIVVDVGGVYDPNLKRFDHHQREFSETLNSIRPNLTEGKFSSIRLSSAGLIYAHYGMEVISEILRKHSNMLNTKCLKEVFLHIYESFVEELDAIDNGIPMYDEGKAKYRITTHLGARVGRINPVWNDPNPEPADLLFSKAVDLVGSEFVDRVKESYSVWWPAREAVEVAIQNRKKNHESDEIMVLNEACPWMDHFYALEEELNIVGQIKFCIFYDRLANSWRVRSIPIQPHSFICRVFLHKDWRGLKEVELSAMAKLEDCIFCHSTGFIGGHKTKEGAIQMAVRSLEAAQVDKE